MLGKTVNRIEKRCLISALLLLVITLSFTPVSAEQILYMNFDGYKVHTHSTSASTSANTTYELITTIVFSFPSQVYVSGFTVEMSLGGGAGFNTYYLKLKIVYPDNTTIWTSEWSQSASSYVGSTIASFKAPEPKLTNQITVEVWGRQEQTYRLTVKKVAVHTLNQPAQILSKVLEMYYIPPGAGGTYSAMVLNQTEVYLTQPLSLAEGSISFWIKWDGSPVTISDNIWIDSNGYLNFRSSTGSVFTIEASPPVGQYSPIYVGWKSGEGYLKVNGAEKRFVWDGTFNLTKFGNISQSTTTLLDEFKIWSTYISSDQIESVAQLKSYSLSDGNKTIIIEPEGGVTLPEPVKATVFDVNFNPLADPVLLSSGNQNATIPQGAQYLHLSVGNVERLIYLGNLSSLRVAIPSTEVSSLTTVRVQVPMGYDLIEIKTPTGSYVHRALLNNGTSTTFTAITGAYYLFTAVNSETGDVISSVRQVTSDLLSLQSSKLVYATQVEAEGLYYFLEENQEAVIVFTSPTPKDINFTFQVFDVNGNLITDTISENITGVSYYEWHILLDFPFYDAVAVVTTLDGSQTWNVTIPGWRLSTTGGWFPEEFVPKVLILSLVGILGTFAVKRENANYVPLVLLIVLGVFTAVGFITVSPGTMITLGVMAVIGMYMSREG